MALKSWKQIVTDIANAFRNLTGSTANIKVGELSGKINALNPVIFDEGYKGAVYLRSIDGGMERFNVTEIKDEIIDTDAVNLNVIWKLDQTVSSSDTDEEGLLYADMAGYFGKVDGFGSLIFKKYMSDQVASVSVSKEKDEVYIADNGGKISKYTKNGDKISSVSVTKQLRSISLDNFGNILSGSTDGHLYKYSSDLVKIWDINFESTQSIDDGCICTDSFNQIYTIVRNFGFYRISTSGVKKELGKGTGYFRMLATDNDGIVYVFWSSGNINYPNKIQRIENDSLVDVVETEEYFYGMKFDINNNLYVGSSDGNLKKHNKDFAVVWNHSIGEIFEGKVLNFDNNCNLYVCCNDSLWSIQNNTYKKKIAYYE